MSLGTPLLQAERVNASGKVIEKARATARPRARHA
jgi:hypothetical protein